MKILSYYLCYFVFVPVNRLVNILSFAKLFNFSCDKVWLEEERKTGSESESKAYYTTYTTYQCSVELLEYLYLLLLPLLLARAGQGQGGDRGIVPRL